MSKLKIETEEKQEQGPHKDWQVNLGYAKDYLKHFLNLKDMNSSYHQEVTRYIDIERKGNYPWILWINTAKKANVSCLPIFFHIPYRDFVEEVKKSVQNYA